MDAGSDSQGESKAHSGSLTRRTHKREARAHTIYDAQPLYCWNRCFENTVHVNFKVRVQRRMLCSGSLSCSGSSSSPGSPVWSYSPPFSAELFCCR